MLRHRYKTLAGLVIGALAGLAVAVLVQLALVSHVESVGREAVEIAAKRTTALAESRVAWVVGGLNDLADRSISSCSQAHLEAMRLTTFAVTPIKDLAVVDPNGQVLCTQLGNTLQIKPITRELNAGSEQVLIGLVRVGEHKDPMVWIRRPGPYGVRSLVALIPADLFVPQEQDTADSRMLRLKLELSDGALVGRSENQVPEAESKRDRLTATAESRRFGLRATASISKQALRESDASLFAVGAISLLVLAGLLVTLGILLPYRNRANPVEQIERAIERREFVPYFQPIIDIRTGSLCGAEVLIRWRKSDGSIVPPGMFIPLAESTGLIVDMTRELMRRVCDEAGAVLARHPHLKVSFNLTAEHFLDDRIVQDAALVFGRSPVRASQVVFEVTERQPLSDLEGARNVISMLQRLGYRVAIDDVGAGHSGLSSMLKLGVDIIKIDKLFIDAIGTERHSATIIDTLVELARNMNMEIVAEGVETFEQVALLRARGIHQAQGYVFSPPLPAARFLELVAAVHPGPRPAVTAPATEAEQATDDLRAALQQRAIA